MQIYLIDVSYVQVLFKITSSLFTCFSLEFSLPCFFSQSFATDKNTAALLKSAIFYIAVTLEAFIFCFAGEYLSAKVSRNISFYRGTVVS